MIEIYTNTKIYIAAPAASATGGPELLHQLGYHLRYDLNMDAYMYYYPTNIENPIHPNYKMYSVPFVREIEDDSKNVLVVPEVISGIEILQNYTNVRKILWWLSVDNFYISIFLNSKKEFFIYKNMDKVIDKFDSIDINELILQKLNSLKIPKRIIKIINNVNFHFAQSYYALSFLKNKLNIPNDKTAYLSDYLNKEFLKIKTDLSKKENIVAYNPKKGITFTKKIIKSANDIKFIPLINMSREDVIKTLQRAKVYIDFGNHPGKDRIPREAAILGCCVITGKRGSATFYEDVPIPNEYKFEDRKENIPKIIEKIKDCFENYEERYKDFKYYRQVIKNEPQKFTEDLRKIFTKIF